MGIVFFLLLKEKRVPFFLFSHSLLIIYLNRYPAVQLDFQLFVSLSISGFFICIFQEKVCGRDWWG